MERHVQVDIWSDVVCPWCYVGKRRFERALEGFPERDRVEVTFRSFELDPHGPRDAGTTLDERLARKYGVSLEEAQAMHRRMSAVAAEEGLEYRFDIARPGNTFDAHRLLHLGLDEGRQPELKERLMRAYFTEGLPIGQPETLAGLAAEAGVDEARAREVLAGEEYAEAVREDEALAATLGIQGVPFFVFDRRFGVSGAQPPEVLTGALHHAWTAEPVETA